MTEVSPGKNGRRPAETILVRALPSAQGSWIAPRQSAVATNFQGRLGVRHIPGLQRPQGPDDKGRPGMGMNIGQNRERDRLLVVTARRMQAPPPTHTHTAVLAVS